MMTLREAVQALAEVGIKGQGGGVVIPPRRTRGAALTSDDGVPFDIVAAITTGLLEGREGTEQQRDDALDALWNFVRSWRANGEAISFASPPYAALVKALKAVLGPV